MYTLLLVDDEEEVMQVIARKVKWEELGFSVIGHANSGLKALEMLEETQPDVVMTDIKMPYMDGLELCGTSAERHYHGRSRSYEDHAVRSTDGKLCEESSTESAG